MANSRLACLFEAQKRGFTLAFDPKREKNRCFYQCVAKSLSVDDDALIDLIENYMLSNQMVDSFNEVRYFFYLFYLTVITV